MVPDFVAKLRGRGASLCFANHATDRYKRLFVCVRVYNPALALVARPEPRSPRERQGGDSMIRIDPRELHVALKRDAEPQPATATTAGAREVYAVER